MCRRLRAGVIESGNIGGGTGDAQHRTFQINTCGPIDELVAEPLNFSLALQAFGITDGVLKFGEVDYRDSKVVEDIRDQRLRNGAWTLNKHRAEIGEPPVPGGDDAVLVDRQNLVLWAHMAELLRARLRDQPEGGSCDVGRASGVGLCFARLSCRQRGFVVCVEASSGQCHGGT